MRSAEEKAADEWWDGLSAERRSQVHRWVAQRGTVPAFIDEAQLTIDDELTLQGANNRVTGKTL